MPARRLREYRNLVGEKLTAAFAEDLPPRDVAGTFAFGVFVASLPNLGTALLLFAALAYYVDRVSKLALVAAVVVMNPPVKWAVYLASLWVGNRLLGPAQGATLSEFSVAQLWSVGPQVLVRLVAGNLVVSTLLAVVGFVLALRFVRELRERDIAVVERLPTSE